MAVKRYNWRLKKEENKKIIKIWHQWQEKRKKLSKKEGTGLTFRDLAKLFNRSLKNVWLVIKRGY